LASISDMPTDPGLRNVLLILHQRAHDTLQYT
jgi:hypothetical protein